MSGRAAARALAFALPLAAITAIDPSPMITGLLLVVLLPAVSAVSDRMSQVFARDDQDHDPLILLAARLQRIRPTEEAADAIIGFARESMPDVDLRLHLVDPGDGPAARVPLIADGVHVGWFSVDQPISPGDLGLLELLAATAAPALRNAALQRDLELEVEQGRRAREDLRRRRRSIVERTAAERQRLERDLHDGAQQRLTAAILAIGLLRRRPGDRAHRQRVEELLMEARSDIERVASGGESLLQGRTIGGAVHDLAASLPTGIVAEVDVDEAVDQLPSSLRTGLYLMVSEALQNVTKHAEAAHVQVSLRMDDGRVHALVRDDGRGFDPDAGITESSGLHRLRHRAQLLRGTADVRSSPGAGTEVSFSVPALDAAAVER